MFKIIDVEQGTDEWFEARLGKWTASNYDKCVTPTGKISASAKKINAKLIAEIITGEIEETFTSQAMERGKELEGEALFVAQSATGIDFKTVGFLDSELGY